MPQLLRKEGFLLKRSKGRGSNSVARGISWAEMNCKLKSDSTMQFYDEEDDLKCEYVINSTTRVVIMTADESDGNDHCFSLYTSGQEDSIVLGADNAEEMKSWVDFIEQYKASLVEH